MRVFNIRHVVNLSNSQARRLRHGPRFSPFENLKPWGQKGIETLDPIGHARHSIRRRRPFQRSLWCFMPLA